MTDEDFKAWIRTLPSALDNRSYSEWVPELGEWRNPACHVRRAGDSGIAYKAEYSTIPLTHAQHSYQHNFGELACLAKFTRDMKARAALAEASPADAERFAKNWFDAQVVKYREMWRAKTGEAPWEAELQNA